MLAQSNTQNEAIIERNYEEIQDIFVNNMDLLDSDSMDSKSKASCSSGIRSDEILIIDQDKSIRPLNRTIKLKK